MEKYGRIGQQRHESDETDDETVLVQWVRSDSPHHNLMKILPYV